MNKRGLFFATLTVLIIAVFVFSYSVDKSMEEKDVAMDELGVAAVASLNSFYKGERIKYFIEEAGKYSFLNALFLMGEDGGIYDKSKCEIKEGYVVWRENCEPDNLNEDFKKYFNDNFFGYLKLSGIGLDGDDFNLEVKGNLVVSGDAKKDLGIDIGGTSEVIDYDIKEIDNKKVRTTSENLRGYMDIIGDYSREKGVPDQLVLAVIIQESGGNEDAVSEAGCYGLMQICPKAHPGYFDGTKCDGGNAREDVDCNIKAGIEILSGYYKDYRNGIPREKIENFCGNEEYVEKYFGYRGWSAALRAYNGLGCREGADVNYVENVLKWYNLLSGKKIEEFYVGRIGTYYIKPSFLVDVKYEFVDYSRIKEVARDCLKSEEKCSMIDYTIKKEKIGNVMVFEFKSNENLEGIKPVVIKFALPIET